MCRRRYVQKTRLKTVRGDSDVGIKGRTRRDTTEALDGGVKNGIPLPYSCR